MLAWKIAPALATGNTVVLKPAEFTPLTALAFAHICQEVALPPGVVNIVTGDGSTGEALVKHPDVDKIAFTGSTEVGRAIRKATAESHKKLSLELGGKSPFVIFEDADLDSAVEGLVDGIWFNQGQVCCAGSRLLMQESVAEKLIGKIQDRMNTLRIGPPLDKAIDIGAIVARVQLERIQRLVDQGIAEGATCWQPAIPVPSRGLYFPPTLLWNVHPTSVVAQQEIFGPVLAAMSFRTPREAVELANNTVYGLAASVWSESINVSLHVAAQLKAGVVWVNCTNLFDAACGFGGYRESGYGREGGREGLLEYLEPAWFKSAPPLHTTPFAIEQPPEQPTDFAAPPIDRTVKLYIGGKQARPDSGYSFEVRGADGRLLGEAPLGNRKDIRNVALAMKEPIGTVAVICPADAPLLGFLSLVMPAISTGNTVIAIPSEEYPLIASDLYQVFETSDLPDGVVNIVTGRAAELMKTLAEHDDVDALWCFTDEASAAAVKTLSVGNLKQVFTNEGRAIDWFDVKQGEGRWFLDHTVQVKNIWVPYGE